MRNRLEDLGRILVLVDQLIDEVDDQDYPYRPKDCLEWFDNLDEKEQGLFVHNACYLRETILEKLYEVLAIAKGFDSLNEIDE